MFKNASYPDVKQPEYLVLKHIWNFKTDKFKEQQSI